LERLQKTFALLIVGWTVVTKLTRVDPVLLSLCPVSTNFGGRSKHRVYKKRALPWPTHKKSRIFLHALLADCRTEIVYCYLKSISQKNNLMMGSNPSPLWKLVTWIFFGHKIMLWKAFRATSYKTHQVCG